MKIIISADHAGLSYKNILLKDLQDKGYEVTDGGAFEEKPDDYPDYAEIVAKAILNKEADRGIVICGSGVGVSVAANKFKSIRAAICHDNYSAHQGVEHDDMNVLCMGARVIGIEPAREIIYSFLQATYSQEERHARRLEKIHLIETKNML